VIDDMPTVVPQFFSAFVSVGEPLGLFPLKKARIVPVRGNMATGLQYWRGARRISLTAIRAIELSPNSIQATQLKQTDMSPTKLTK
jgi:hypothetical protein